MARRVCDLCSHMRTVFGFMIRHCCFEILNFWTKTLHLYFALGPATYVLSPANSHGDVSPGLPPPYASPEAIEPIPLAVTLSVASGRQACREEKRRWHTEEGSLQDVWDFPGGPVVKTSPSSVGGAGSIAGQGAKIPHASRPKNQIIKQKQYCNKFNKDFKNGPHQKKKKKN